MNIQVEEDQALSNLSKNLHPSLGWNGNRFVDTRLEILEGIQVKTGIAQALYIILYKMLHRHLGVFPRLTGSIVVEQTEAMANVIDTVAV